MTQALRSYGLLLAALIIVAACGADAPDDGGAGGIDGGVARIDADTGGCQGCVDVFGNCEPGDQDRDCGGGGASCETCLNGDTCVDFACETPPSCNADNCAGCCLPDSTCVVTASQDAAQCGADGLACTSCDSGLCAAGVCVEACSPTTCAGCCNGPTIDDCVEVGGDQNATSCGVDGMACEACPANSTCALGLCVDTSCNLDCPTGCCEGATCLDGDSNAQCGTAGEACFSCGADQTCNAGVCNVDPNSIWNFVIVSADVPTTDSEGNAWDGQGGAPDVFIEVTLGVNSGAPVTDTTETLDDSFTFQYSPPDGEVVHANVPASKILDSIRLVVIDSDVFQNDTMISIIDNSPPESVFGGGLFQLSVDGFTIRFRVVKP